MVNLMKLLFGVVAALAVMALFHIDPAFAQEAPEAIAQAAEEARRHSIPVIRRGC